MDYGDLKDLAKKTASDKFLRDKAFNIGKNPKYDGYQCRRVPMIYKFFDKKSAGSGVNLHANNKTIKVKPVDVKDNTCIDSRELHSAELCSTSCIQRSCTLIKTLMIKISNLKLVIMCEFPSTKTFLLKDAHKIGLKKFL